MNNNDEFEIATASACVFPSAKMPTTVPVSTGVILGQSDTYLGKSQTAEVVQNDFVHIILFTSCG